MATIPFYSMSEFEFRLLPFCHFYSYVKIKSGKMKKFEIHIEFFINIKKNLTHRRILPVLNKIYISVLSQFCSGKYATFRMINVERCFDSNNCYFQKKYEQKIIYTIYS